MALFTLEDVRFNSRTEELIKGISLTIEKGSISAIEGESGSGKSLLLKLIAGILVPSGGKVRFEGFDIAAMNKEADRAFRKRCAMVFQDCALWQNQNILQNLSLPLQTHFPKMRAKERMERIDEVCGLVRYTRSLALRPADLSAGEQKRIAFARAIICNPEVLLLDECIESLDRKGTGIIVSLLHKFVDSGNTMIYISHSAAFSNEFAGTVYQLENGTLTDTNAPKNPPES